jgi:hypothetical protein
MEPIGQRPTGVAARVGMVLGALPSAVPFSGGMDCDLGSRDDIGYLIGPSVVKGVDDDG